MLNTLKSHFSAPKQGHITYLSSTLVTRLTYNKMVCSQLPLYCTFLRVLVRNG